MPSFIIGQVAQPALVEKTTSPSYSFTGVEVSTVLIAVIIAVGSWIRSELKTKGAAADAETALIKSLQQELTDKDEEIDKQRILIWRLEKEIRMLRQTMEFSGSFSQPTERVEQ